MKKQCTKCAGTGVYAQMVLNGVPYSPTGTTCWKCNGTGKTGSDSPSKTGKRRTRCPRCNMLTATPNEHTYNHFHHGADHIITCKSES